MAWTDFAPAWMAPWLLLAQGVAAQDASVQGPVTLAIGKDTCAPESGAAHTFPLEIVAASPPALPATGWKLVVSAEGAARVVGPATVTVPSGPSPVRRRVCVAFAVQGLGPGTVKAVLRSADDAASPAWQPNATLFVLQAADGLLTSESSPLELWRSWLRRELTLGRLSQAEHDRQLSQLLERGALSLPGSK